MRRDAEKGGAAGNGVKVLDLDTAEGLDYPLRSNCWQQSALRSTFLTALLAVTASFFLEWLWVGVVCNSTHFLPQKTPRIYTQPMLCDNDCDGDQARLRFILYFCLFRWSKTERDVVAGMLKFGFGV